MTTLCLCDWVETREDKALRLSMHDTAQPVEDDDGPRFIPPIPALPALPDWPSAPLWPDALAWTCGFDVAVGREHR
jgi:hypothetical protein